MFTINFKMKGIPGDFFLALNDSAELCLVDVECRAHVIGMKSAVEDYKKCIKALLKEKDLTEDKAGIILEKVGLLRQRSYVVLPLINYINYQREHNGWPVEMEMLVNQLTSTVISSTTIR